MYRLLPFERMCSFGETIGKGTPSREQLIQYFGEIKDELKIKERGTILHVARAPCRGLYIGRA